MRIVACFVWMILAGVLTPLAAQYDSYQFRREVQGVDQPAWYRLPLPSDMLPKLRDDMHDLRLMRGGGDTLETPFLLHSEPFQESWTRIPVREVNARSNRAPFYVTFRYEPGEQVPNEIRVNVAQRNFDCLVSVESSDNRLIWNPLVEDVRILGVVDANVSFAQRSIPLPRTGDKFLRVVWQDPEVEITSVELGTAESRPGRYQPLPILDWELETDTDRGRTVIRVDLAQRFPVARVALQLQDRDAEYVRTLDLRYARQTVEEPNGEKKYLWREWDRQVLSSLAPPVFHVDQAYTDHLEITIYDQTALPLAIESLEVAALSYELRAMLNPEFPYELIYGSQTPRAPGYARSRPPQEIRTATLGPEEFIHPETVSTDQGDGFLEGEGLPKELLPWGQFFAGFVGALLLMLGYRWWRKRRQRRKNGGK